MNRPAPTFLVPDHAKSRADRLLGDAQTVLKAQGRATTAAALTQAIPAAERLLREAGIALASLRHQLAEANAQQETAPQ